MSGPKHDASTPLTGFITRVVTFDAEIQVLQADRREVLKEAVEAGFDPRALKAVARLIGQAAKSEHDDLAVLIESYYAAATGGEAAKAAVGHRPGQQSIREMLDG